MPTTRGALDESGLATLKQLALVGAFEGRTKLSCADLADRLEASTQTASRRLRDLEDSACIEREVVSDGQWVSITDAGADRLREEYAAYRRIFAGDQTVELTGRVTTGMGEGKHYVTLSGYMRQFRDRLGYEPYPGTLNVSLDDESEAARPRLEALEPVTIDGWEDEGRTYGPAYCYPVTITRDADANTEAETGAETEAATVSEASGAETYSPAHIITPERTHHGDDNLELVAPARLRETLGLEDGSRLRVVVESN